MTIWKNKRCKGMDIVEQIVFTRQDFDVNGNEVIASATYVVGADNEKSRDLWTQDEIDAIADKLVTDLDATIELRKQAILEGA